MRRHFKIGILFFVCLSTLLKCSSTLDVHNGYVITETSFKEIVKSKDKTLVLFWTNWCGASKTMIEQYYFPLQDSITKNNLNLNLILLAGDEDVKIKDIDHHRSLGISSFYIEKPGWNPILNRMSIKSFINDAFPENELEHINQFQYGIPVILLLNKELDIENEKDYDKCFQFIYDALGIKVEVVENQ